MNVRLKSVIVLSAIFLTGCAATTTPGIATEAETEVCRQIGAELPTRSRNDTVQTQAEIQRLYAVFGLTCPAQVGLIP